MSTHTIRGDWERIPLGHLARFRNGANFTASSFGTGLKIINVGDFGDRSVPDYGSLSEVSPAAISSEEALLADRDIVAVRSNGNRELIGRTMLIKDPPRVTHSAFTIRIRVHPEGLRRILPEYLAYVLRGPSLRSLMSAQGSGTNISNLNQGILSRLLLDVPPCFVQEKIVTALIAYDHLIENNTHRIQILEEMAQAIYHEWFVEFRFPGHEDVRTVDSKLGPIPEGWSVLSFTQLADVLSGGTPSTRDKAFWGGDIPFFTPRDAPDTLCVLDTERHITPVGLENCRSERFAAGTVFITARGTVGKVVAPALPMALNQSCYALRGRDGLSQDYLLYLLRNSIDYLTVNTGGATFDTIIIDTFRRMRVTRPPDSLVNAFDRLAHPLRELEVHLLRINTNLRATASLLLPRLISGEIDVSNLDIGNAEPAA
jgi:type I restriction enzyme S subunit